MDIRQALLQRLHQSSKEELKDIIESGMASKEETILPGLGVLFEEYYKSLENPDAFLQILSHLLS